jgi:hypothetical protein
MRTDSGEEFDRRKCAVGDQHDAATRQPATDLQDGLSRPIEQCFECSWLVGIKAFRGRKKSEETATP